MYMLHVLVVSPECAQAVATVDYGIVHLLSLVTYMDAASSESGA